MKHKFAIIGLGIMGRRMLENVLRHPQFEVCGLWDPAAESVAKTRFILPLKFDTCSIIFYSLFTKKTRLINMLANVDP